MKILLVSDDKNICETISNKLIFLRKDDTVVTSSYDSAKQNIELTSAQVAFIHENDDREITIQLIKDFHENKELNIILLANSYDSEFILKSIDSGANDFILTTAEDIDFVIKIVNHIKQSSCKKTISRNNQILQQLNVVNEITGIYEYTYSKQIIENSIDFELVNAGSFMAIAPSQKGKTKFSEEALAKAIKASIREEDIITHGKGTNFYIFLPYTDMNGAASVFEKIKEKSDFDICAGICDIAGINYNKFEKKAIKALSEAIATKAAIIFSEDEPKDTLNEWLEAEENKNYKIFRQMFNKKLEKIITPVFYRLQKTYEEKLFDTKIEQYVNDEQCVFNLQNNKFSSSLKIIYPGFTKIVISINHDGLDSPENREIKMPLAKITQQELVEIIEDFIKEFKSRGL